MRTPAWSTLGRRSLTGLDPRFEREAVGRSEDSALPRGLRPGPVTGTHPRKILRFGADRKVGHHLGANQTDADPGALFTAAGQTLRRSVMRTQASGRIWAEDPAAGKRRDLTFEEHRGFWTWAMIEVLRHRDVLRGTIRTCRGCVEVSAGTRGAGHCRGHGGQRSRRRAPRTDREVRRRASRPDPASRCLRRRGARHRAPPRLHRRRRLPVPPPAPRDLPHRPPARATRPATGRSSASPSRAHERPQTTARPGSCQPACSGRRPQARRGRW
jgi:hypothetical protein